MRIHYLVTIERPDSATLAGADGKDIMACLRSAALAISRATVLTDYQPQIGVAVQQIELGDQAETHEST